MESDIKEIRKDVDQIRLKVYGLEQKVEILGPVDTVEFKATVLVTLKSLDHDLDKISQEIDSIVSSYENYRLGIANIEANNKTALSDLKEELTSESTLTKEELTKMITDIKLETAKNSVIITIVTAVIVAGLVSYFSVPTP